MERAHISSILVGLVNDFSPDNNVVTQQSRSRRSSYGAAISRALRGLVDFANISQFHAASTTTLTALEKALRIFHENSFAFIELGACDNLNFVKNHMMSHYKESITYKGATDNFNTQFTERLHIDLVKDAYRHTNRRNELSQMITILDRKEKLHLKQLFINHYRGQQLINDQIAEKEPSIFTPYIPVLPRRPSAFGEEATTIATLHHADSFVTSLTSYISAMHHRVHRQQHTLSSIDCNLLQIDVYHYLRFCLSTSSCSESVDYIYAIPTTEEKPARFDVALVFEEGEGIKGTSYYFLFFIILLMNRL